MLYPQIMVYSKTLTFNTQGLSDVIDVTEDVEKVVLGSKIKNGLAVCFVSGSTAGITTIEYEPNLIEDFKEIIEKLVPQKSYRHDKTWGDANGFSHLRSSLLGPSISVPIRNGKLTLGTWQQIILVDFDNRPRKREVQVQIIGE